MRKITDLVGDLLKRYKQLKMNIKDEEQLMESEIVRCLAMGISAGSLDLRDYEHWFPKAKEKQVKRLKLIQDIRKDMFLQIKEFNDKNAGG